MSAVFRLPRLGFPPEEMFDEVYHAKTALQYLQGENPTEWVHPPTAKLLIAAGVWVFGYEPWAWRLMPVLAGIALAPVFYLLARTVLATERAAVLASVILLADGVYLVQSRTAMTNIFAVCFQLAAALFLLRAVLRPVLPVKEMMLAGLFLGLALSTRWTSLFATAFLGLVLLAVRRRRVLTPRELGLTFVAFAAIPLVLYVVSYVPWMMQVDPWQTRLRELPEHTQGGVELPRRPARGASLLQLLVHLALAVPPDLVLLQPDHGGPGDGARDRRPRQPVAVVGVGAGDGVGAGQRRARPRPAAAVLRARLRVPVPAVGDLARAPSTTATTCSRPFPTPASAWESCSTATGTRRAATSPVDTWRWSWSRSSSSIRSWPRSPFPRPGTTSTSRACARGRGSRPGSSGV